MLKETQISQYLFCSSVWVFGKSTLLPITENSSKLPLCEYGIEKLKCEEYLFEIYKKENFPATVIYPGQISGPGWAIINPLGNDDYWIFNKIRLGEEIILPNFEMETLHFVHAEDVAQVFFKSIIHRDSAIGQGIFAVGSQSITLLGFAQLLYRHFGKDENIRFLSWDKWSEHYHDNEFVKKTYLHIARSGFFSIEKGKTLISYEPKHTLTETVLSSVDFMVEQKWFDIEN